MFVFGGASKAERYTGSGPASRRSSSTRIAILQLTTDFRDVLAELTVRHLGVKNAKGVFPGHTAKSLSILG